MHMLMCVLHGIFPPMLRRNVYSNYSRTHTCGVWVLRGFCLLCPHVFFSCLSVVPGYWAEEVVSLLNVAAAQPGFVRPKMCIISAYPDGLAPYERSELSKDCLRPSNLHLRDWQVRNMPWGVPFLRKAVRGEGQSVEARTYLQYVFEIFFCVFLLHFSCVFFVMFCFWSCSCFVLCSLGHQVY